MSTAAETTRAVIRPASRSVRLRRSPVGRAVVKLPFWFLILAIAVYALFPFYWALRSAITPDSQLFNTPIQYFPSHPTWAHFHDALSSSFFRKALLNSTIVAGSVTLISLAIGSLAAYALGRFRFRGKSFVLYLMLSMTIFPQIAILGALYTMFSGFHIVGPIDFPKLYDSPWALVFSYLIFTLPFTIWVLTSFMRALPGDLEEAAYVDGATPLQVFWKVLAAADRSGPGHDRPARLHRGLERVPLRGLVHPVAGPLHGAGRDHLLHRVERQRVPVPVGDGDGRDDRGDAAADRGDPRPAATDPGWAYRGSREGLDSFAGLGVEEVEPGRVDRELDLLAQGDAGLRADAGDQARRHLVSLAETDVGVLAGVRGGGARDDGGRLRAEVDEHLGAEWLGEVGGHLDPAVRGRIRLDRRVLEVLRPDPEDDLSARRNRQGPSGCVRAGRRRSACARRG